VIDKPLFYLAANFGNSEIRDIFSGTRTLGHTGLFFLAFLMPALLLKSQKWLALALGILTHLALDTYGAVDMGTSRNGVLHMILWPIFGTSFPQYEFLDFHAYWSPWVGRPHLILEILGILALLILVIRKKKTKKKDVNRP